jgi:hypothetical protein
MLSHISSSAIQVHPSLFIWALKFCINPINPVFPTFILFISMLYSKRGRHADTHVGLHVIVVRIWSNQEGVDMTYGSFNTNPSGGYRSAACGQRQNGWHRLVTRWENWQKDFCLYSNSVSLDKAVPYFFTKSTTSVTRGQRHEYAGACESS